MQKIHHKLNILLATTQSIKKIKQKVLRNKNITEIFEPYSFGIVKKCNIAAKYAQANCIIVATDDTIPELNWDEKVLDYKLVQRSCFKHK